MSYRNEKSKRCKQENKLLAEYEAKRDSSLPAPAGSLAHVHFEITTQQGNRAMIKGDINMPEATRKALAEMVDALSKAVKSGELKAPENVETEPPER